LQAPTLIENTPLHLPPHAIQLFIQIKLFQAISFQRRQSYQSTAKTDRDLESVQKATEASLAHEIKKLQVTQSKLTNRIQGKWSYHAIPILCMALDIPFMRSVHICGHPLYSVQSDSKKFMHERDITICFIYTVSR